MFEKHYLKYSDCEISIDSDRLAIYINNELQIYEECEIPISHNGTGEIIIDYKGLQLKQLPSYNLAKALFSPNGYSKAHYHKYLIEDYYIVYGSAIVIVNHLPRSLHPGDCITIKPYQIHQVFNPSKQEELLIIVKCTPPWTKSDFHLAEK